MNQPSYKGLDIPDGNAAQRVFVELIDESVPDSRKVQLRKSMLAYCKKDTDVTVQLVDWLVAISQNRAAV